MRLDVRVDNVNSYSNAVRIGLSEVVMATAFMIEAEAKRSIMRRKSKYKKSYSVSGRVVVKRRKGQVVSSRVKKVRRVHWSSAPGDPPNTDTGFLVNSIYSRRISTYKSQVLCTARYGLPLELGWRTKTGKSVPARPFMRPAMEKNRPRFNAMVKGVLRDYK